MDSNVEAAKLNVDGGISKNGDSGAATMVCIDKTGLFLGASTIVFNTLDDPASIEAHTCNEVLALAKDLNLQRVVIASDCLKVINNVKKGSATIYAPVFHECYS